MPTLIQAQPGTDITWLASGGTNAFTLTSLAANAGRQGAQHNFGTSARDFRFFWTFYMQVTSATTVGDFIRIYWKSGDGTHYDNDDGTGDIAVSSEDKLRNLKYLGSLEIDENSATPEFSVSGWMPQEYVLNQYGMPVVWNDLAVAFSSTAAEHGFILHPVPREIQD